MNELHTRNITMSEPHSSNSSVSEPHTYYCYVMGVKLIRILNYECECVRIRALYFMTRVSMWRWIKTGSF